MQAMTGEPKGQSYRLSFDQDAGTATLRFRFPNAQGHWQWCADPVTLRLPTVLVERLKEGEPLAPTLRELIKPDGSRVAVLDVSIQAKVCRADRLAKGRARAGVRLGRQHTHHSGSPAARAIGS